MAEPVLSVEDLTLIAAWSGWPAPAFSIMCPLKYDRTRF